MLKAALPGLQINLPLAVNRVSVEAVHRPKHDFLARLQASFETGSFVKLTLGHPSEPGGPVRKLLFRPVVIRGEKRCSVVSRFATRDETKNLLFAEALALAGTKLGAEFLSANLFTETEEVQLELGPKERLRVTPATHAPASLDHDRNKSRWVDSASRYLVALGVTDSTGKVRERMGDKFRQIERFVDLLASAFRESALALPDARRPVIMCDMGAGKGYLTFATFDYFRRLENVEVAITGVEQRDDLVAFCNRVARECGFEQLRFEKGAIDQFQFPALDLLVALHACNTATDDALAAGVRAGASVILAAPCCHKEVRPQVDRSALAGPLSDVLRHGLFAERHAEIATDALRVLLLERAGYRVRVSEFVAAEHTAKNVMIIATRRGDHPADAGDHIADFDRRIAELKLFYGIEHHRLEELLLERR